VIPDPEQVVCELMKRFKFFRECRSDSVGINGPSHNSIPLRKSEKH
jgi:hypothetical protein